MKTGCRDFRPGPTQTSLYSLRKNRDATNFRFMNKRDSTFRVAKLKALIVTGQLDPVVQSIVSLTISLRHKFVKQISA